MENKVCLRDYMRKKRTKIDNKESMDLSIKLVEHVSLLLNSVKNVAIYHAVKQEMNLSSVMSYCLLNSINLFTPIANKNTRIMRFEHISSVSHRDIFYAIDYKLTDEIKWYNLDLVLIPLLAVDGDGFRLGQGGGYYDATFAKNNDQSGKKPPILCGVGYDWQLIDEVPHDKWDLQLDYFVSDQRLVKFVKY